MEKLYRYGRTRKDVEAELILFWTNWVNGPLYFRQTAFDTRDYPRVYGALGCVLKLAP
jgi:hypothetical protein